MEYLNQERTAQLWEGVKSALTKKQDILTGTSGQFVGFNKNGEPIACATGVPDGVATLNANGVLTAAQRPCLSEIEGGSRCNLLDNWYFAAPINQRGHTVYTEPGYTIDRWRLDAPSRLSILTGFIRLEQVNTEDQPLYYQPFAQEEGIFYSGKALTFSILYRTDSSSFSLTVADGNLHELPIPPSNTFSFASITIDLTGALNYIGIKMNSLGESGVGNYIDLIAAKLEIGRIQTLMTATKNGAWALNDSPPNQTLELEKCQKYQIFGPMSASYQHHYQDMDRITLPLPAPMRAIPTIIGFPEIRKLDDNKRDSGAKIFDIYLQTNHIVFAIKGMESHCYIYFQPGTGLDANL